MVGREAKKYLITDSDKTIYSVKRLMGKSFIDIENNSEKLTYKISHRREGLVRVEIAGKEYTPIELSSMILLDLKKEQRNILENQFFRLLLQYLHILMIHKDKPQKMQVS